MARRSPFRFTLPLLALAGMVFAAWSIASQPGTPPRAEPPSAPPRNPFPTAVAGLGEVEPVSETIAIGTDLAGLIAAVHVRPGERVAAGAPLLSLDDRRLRAVVAEAEAALIAARASRDEAEASLVSAEAERRRARLDAERYRTLSRGEVAASRQRVESADADARKAEATVALARARIAAAEAAAQQADAALTRARVDLDKTVLRAPIAGTVLRLNARPGEYAQPGAAESLIVFGDVSVLHVRVQVDETDAPRLRASGSAVAFLRGDGTQSAELAFVRIEPLARPKRFLSNAPGERVDTRVVEAIYRLVPDALPVQVGQMLDVFVEAAPRAAAVAAR
ncbi:efflux RND transporter periplasmic adaptor subunit [Elioraea sp.]|uniref:efflux RND transporter periplasmic adaptor subunit n=1 Tax=Elioraea sp. TaxID=2185103 RepID=UPI003F6F69FA